MTTQFLETGRNIEIEELPERVLEAKEDKSL